MSKTIKILWIEDETAKAVAERLSYLQSSFEIDYEIEISRSYIEAQEAIKKAMDFDVILIDIRIPFGAFDTTTEQKYGLKIIDEIFKINPNLISKVRIYANESWEDINKNDYLVNKEVKREAFLQKKDCRSNVQFENFVLGK